jgi:hypothetical protein
MFQFFPFSKVQSHTSLGRTVGSFTGGNKVLSDVNEGKRCIDCHKHSQKKSTLKQQQPYTLTPEQQQQQ